jgi:hypothetical protein
MEALLLETGGFDAPLSTAEAASAEQELSRPVIKMLFSWVL